MEFADQGELSNFILERAESKKLFAENEIMHW